MKEWMAAKIFDEAPHGSVMDSVSRSWSKPILVQRKYRAFYCTRHKLLGYAREIGSVVQMDYTYDSTMPELVSHIQMITHLGSLLADVA